MHTAAPVYTSNSMDCVDNTKVNTIIYVRMQKDPRLHEKYDIRTDTNTLASGCLPKHESDTQRGAHHRILNAKTLHNRNFINTGIIHTRHLRAWHKNSEFARSREMEAVTTTNCYISDMIRPAHSRAEVISDGALEEIHSSGNRRALHERKL